MGKGIVKFYNETKGYGFITEDASNKEFFVHVSGLTDQIKTSDKVSFEIQEGKRGLSAINVKRI